MKKIILFIFVLVLLGGCDNKKSNSSVKEEKDDEIISQEKVKEGYVDNNPIKLSFYNKTSSSITLINSIDCHWKKGTDMTWPNVFPTNEPSLTSNTVKALWGQYWNDYVHQGYKFGLEISYFLTSGEKIDLTILKFSDNNAGFKYIQIYLYDGYNATTSWFDHLEDNEFTENTVFTSIKLTPSTYIDQVVSPVTLKVFTYNGEDDFDEFGYYRGNSYATVTVNKIN